MPLFFTISLTVLSVLYTEFFPKSVVSFKLSNIGYNIFGFFNQRFAVELFYNRYVSGIILKLGGQTTRDMDKGIIEKVGPNGLQKTFTDISQRINSLSSGIVTVYALYILIGLLSFISILYLTYSKDNYIELIIILYSLLAIVLINSFSILEQLPHLNSTLYMLPSLAIDVRPTPLHGGMETWIPILIGGTVISVLTLISTRLSVWKSNNTGNIVYVFVDPDSLIANMHWRLFVTTAIYEVQFVTKLEGRIVYLGNLFMPSNFYQVFQLINFYHNTVLFTYNYLNGLYDSAEWLSDRGFSTKEIDASIDMTNSVYRINIYTVRKLESFVLFFNPAYARKPLYENEN